MDNDAWKLSYLFLNDVSFQPIRGFESMNYFELKLN